MKNNPVLLNVKRRNPLAGQSMACSDGIPFADRNLSTMIDVAGEISLAGQGTLRMAKVVRDFRNLAHPGKDRRGDYVIEAHEAEAAEAGLNATELHAHNCDSLILEHLLPFRKQI